MSEIIICGSGVVFAFMCKVQSKEVAGLIEQNALVDDLYIKLTLKSRTEKNDSITVPVQTEPPPTGSQYDALAKQRDN